MFRSGFRTDSREVAQVKILFTGDYVRDRLVTQPLDHDVASCIPSYPTINQWTSHRILSVINVYEQGFWETVPSVLHGEALQTVKMHSTPQGITLFAACFCPFVQRVWTALEYFHIPYRYSETLNRIDEVDPYRKPQELLQVSPKGLVPALRFENTSPLRSLNESTVILEFLEDSAATGNGKSLLPSSDDPYARALVRLQCDHVNRNLVPAFYHYLQAQEESAMAAGAQEFVQSLEGLTSLLERANSEVGSIACGLWNEDGELSLTDVMAGPWLLRATNVLKHYRAFELPPNDRFQRWIARIFSHPAFRATTSTEELYLDSYERYAFNRPNTSLVANAINAGRGLP